ncbi:MAG: IPT/TIG domain-containing protein, partial [Bryobacteraceae bacterium]
PWLLAEIPSCDPLFTTGSAPSNCGTVTFLGYPEAQRSDGNVLPLPWNSVYQAAWGAFLTNLNARYSSNPAFVSIAIAGPVGASDEMIFPTSLNDTVAQPSGLNVDATWAALIQHSFPSTSAYLNTDQVFIDAWKQAIDASEAIFTGVTLFIGADAGNDFPNFSETVTPHPDNTLFAQDCSNSPKTEIMSCEAKTEVLSYFVTVAGPNEKGTQVGGMTASSPATIGNIGVPGVKLLTALLPPSIPFLGGAEFDQPVSGPSTLQMEGCPNPNGGCMGLTVEEAAYNVMTVFFYGTPAAEFYGGTVGTAPIQYLEVPFNDLQYALANPCPAAASPSLGYISLQDLYARASYDLFAMANQASSLPPLTCLKSAPAPTISLVANAEGESPTIAPNTWVEIKGSNLAPVGVSSPACVPGYCWQTSDFQGNQMPTQLDKVSATVNGKNAYVYYISPTQINVLTPPDAVNGPVQVVVANAGAVGMAFTAQAQPLSPSFFVFDGGPYVAATHANGTYIGPATLYPGATTPAKPNEIVVLYANGFGPTNAPVQSGSVVQSGTLSPLPVVKIGGVTAAVQFAGLIGPGEFQFNVTIPASLANGDQSITAAYGGVSTQSGTLITIHN